ncbi:hypothetical protein OEB99_05250 [Actinotalea sp. M2MS4P-6]|uniref:hypothetical protein n=1 Tax=Actinotalea sp. M2MS4P-6 TaxID=2983762 RepID=UPI0021E3A4EB|nr:hypothetical protein [Actinotalea sp. M2MS4P-6]MCV2393709.1 hypothetical protein [Actinotalea sp. M2MS4P-6]
MRFAGRPSWRASLDLPQHLHLAVFVRDAYRLAEHTDAPTPAMPGRLPRVPDLSTEPGAPTPDLADWASWWQEVLAADRAARSRQPLPGSPPDDYARATLQRHAIVDAPDFPSLAERPELQRAARVAFHPFHRWWNRGPDRPRSAGQLSVPGLKGELVDLIHPSPGPGIVNETVTRIERNLGRDVDPFNVDIDVLGTAGPEILVQENDYALVSSALISDPQRFSAWLEWMLLPLA